MVDLSDYTQEDGLKSVEEIIAPNSYYETDAKNNNATEEDVEKKISKPRQLLMHLKPDYILKHLDWNSFKVVFRTWFQNWSTVILMVIPKTSHWLGSAAYLFQIMGFIAVAGGAPIIVNIYVALICSFAACLGWLYSVIAMLIANRLRGSPTMEDLAMELISEGLCTKENIQACILDQVYSGRYLQTNCTVIYAIALILGTMMFGLSQKIHPTFRLPFIIGMIVLIITVCYNVQWPVFAPLVVGLNIIKVMMFSMAMKILCAIFIFPSTASYAYFAGTTGILKSLKASSENNVRFFKSMKPSDPNFSRYKLYRNDVVGLRNKVTPLEFIAGISKYEISYGRLGPGAIGEVRSHIKNLISACSTFEYFYQVIDSRLHLSLGKGLEDRRESVVAPNHHSNLFGSINESYRPVGTYENNRRKSLIRERLNQDSSIIKLKDLDYICDILKPFFLPYMMANIRGLELVIQWMAAANEFRTYTIFSSGEHVKKQEEAHQSLVAYRKELTSTILKLEDYKVFEKYLHDRTDDEETMLSLVSQCSLMTFFLTEQTRLILKLMDILLAIDEHVKKPKIFTFFTKSIFENAQNVFLTLEYEVPQENIPSFHKTENVQFRDPDALPASSVFHLIGFKIVKLHRLLLNGSLWFWFRSACLVTISAVPYFCKTTAHWYFNSRLIWLVIMTGISTSEYTGETIYVFIAKLVYSFFGCLVGMVAWYISCGSGSGNYYGFSVVTAFLFLYFSYYRHFSVHLTLLPAILYAVSAALVLGTSWVDTKYNKLANVGYGFRVAWIRFVSVIIGLCIGFLASVIPRPKSSKVAIRRILSSVLEEVGNIHCDVTAFGQQRIDNKSLHIVGRHDPIIERFRLILIKLAGISHLMNPIRHEISFTGPWPAAKYHDLQKAITDLIQLYQAIHVIFDRVEEPDKWISHIIQRAGWYDSEMNADLFSIIHMCSGSLRSSTPLPKVTQATISLKHFNVLRDQWGIGRYSLNERFYNEKSTKEEEREHRDQEKADFEAMAKLEKEYVNSNNGELHQSMVENLDYQRLFSHDGNLNVVALVLTHIIYQRLDEISILIKSLVGEKYDLTAEFLNRTKYQNAPKTDDLKTE